jgi:hypothetical protein
VKLAGKIPVAPLDDERLTNIERRVVAGALEAAARGHRLDAQRRQLGRALAVAALGVAGFAGWALRGAPSPAPVAEPAAIQVQTDRERSLLDIGDATIASDPATAFAVTRPDGGVLVAMARGKVELAVAKRGGRPPLVVRAGDTDVVVVGTQFSVDYDGRGSALVRVREGEVRVVHQQQATRVAAGQQWQTSRGLVASAERDAPDASAPQAPAPGRDASSAPASGVATRDPGLANRPVPELLHDRTAAVPDAPRPRAPIRTATAPARAPIAGRPGAAAPASDPLLDLRTAIRAQRVEPALDLLEPDPARAIASYYDIAAHHAGDEASRAFYSIAVVYHLKLARNTDALQVLDAYVRRFSGGKEYRAALWLRVRIQCLGKIDDRCRAAAHTYLDEAPDGPAADVAERLTRAE